MLHKTIFPDIFSKLIYAPRDTIQYFIDLKRSHNSVEKEAIAKEFGKNQQMLMDMKQKAIEIIQYHQEHQHKLCHYNGNIFNKEKVEAELKLESDLKQLSQIQIPLFDGFLPNSLNQLNLKDLKFTVYKNQQLLDECDVWFKTWQKNNEIKALAMSSATN